VEHLHPDRSRGILSDFKRFPVILSTSLKFGVKNRIILLLLLSSLGFAVGIIGLEQFWQPQLKIILGSDSQTWIFGVLATGYFLASSLGSIIITPICKLFKNNYTAVLLGNRLLMALLFIVLAMQGSLTGFIVFYWDLFVFNGMSNSPYLTIFNTHVPEDKRSTLLSLQSLSEQAGVLIGSLLTGYLAKRFTISTGWFVGAAVIGVSSIVFLIIPGLKDYMNNLKKGTKKQ